LKQRFRKGVLDSWADAQLESLKDKNLFRKLPIRSKMKAVCFCSNDYLGLSNHSELKKAAIEAIQNFGVGGTGSRLISGTFSSHQELEREIAAWLGKQAALFFNSGFHAGVGILPAISENGVIFSDELNHACLIDGCRLSRAEVLIYKHQDMEHLEFLLKKIAPKSPAWIVSESLFSMEGEKADLKRLADLKKKYGIFLFLDEAHAVGVYGKNGGGLSEELGITESVDLVMGTFSKALGSCGGFVAGNKKVIDFIINKARSFIFTTASPPYLPVINKKALLMMKEMRSERKKLRKIAVEVRRLLSSRYAVKGDDSPIIPLILGESKLTLEFSKRLLLEGIWVQGIRPPTVPEGTSRLRLSLSLSHSSEDLNRLFSVLAGENEKV
jgi:8-amino-7-oxononanoate synthase